MEENTVKSLNVLLLAYMGDSLYEIRIREFLIRRYPREKVKEIHKKAIRLVSASAQARAVLAMLREDFLTEEEIDMVKRGRNKAVNPTKNADPSDYRWATGLESLIGLLFFQEKIGRMEEVIGEAVRLLSAEEISKM